MTCPRCKDIKKNWVESLRSNLEERDKLQADFDLLAAERDKLQADLDLLAAAIRTGGDLSFDLDESGIVDSADRDFWVKTLKRTYIGDSNLNGEFNSGDFVVVFTAGKYEDGIAGNATWATGDWNGDTEFDSSDFVVAFTDGGYELGPRLGAAAVPEPASAGLMMVGACVTLVIGRRLGR